MTNEEFKPFLICDRTDAILRMMDAIQLTDLELVDLCQGISDRLGIPCPLNPEIAFEIHDEGPMVPPPDKESTKENLQGILRECQSNELLTFQVTPHEALSLLSMMQASIMSSITTEKLEIFGRQFIGQFCDRHKLNYPSICEALKLGWDHNCMLTPEEFFYFCEDKDDVDPFNGDGCDRFVENLTEDTQECRSTYVDDFE